MKLSNQNICNLRGCQMPMGGGGCKSFLGGAHPPAAPPRKSVPVLFTKQSYMMQDVKMENVSSFRHIPGLQVLNVLAFAVTVVLFS